MFRIGTSSYQLSEHSITNDPNFLDGAIILGFGFAIGFESFDSMFGFIADSLITVNINYNKLDISLRKNIINLTGDQLNTIAGFTESIY